MHQDANGLIVMDQDMFPGSVGDSCAETSRYYTLCAFNDINPPITISLSLFMTMQGLVRSPDPGCPWGPTDTSGDQLCPFLAAYCLQSENLVHEVINETIYAGYRTGNGQLISPIVFAQMVRANGPNYLKQIWDLSILAQALIMKLPFAWNPNATWNPSTWFVSSSTQTANYLNFVNFLIFAQLKQNSTIACWLARKLFSSKKVMLAISSYYLPEPNNNLVIGQYVHAIPKLFR